MNEVTSWNQTPAALLRHGGLVTETASAHALLDSERRSARAEFDAAWSKDPAMATQRQLAERGWTGAWIEVGSTVPAELRGIYAGASLAQTRSGVDAPGHRDPLIEEHARIVAQRLAAAEARMGPFAGTIG